MGKIKPTLEQKKIFHYIDKRKENLLIEARAGAGKTSTIVAAVNLIPTHASTTFLAFNKHIQEELKYKLPSHVFCYTSHGLGLSALKRKYGDDMEFDEFKVDHHINKKRNRWKLKDEFENVFEQDVYLASIKKMVNLCRSTLTTDKKYMPYLAEKYDIRYSEPKDIKRVLSIMEAITNDRKTFDFTDMIYLPAIDPKIWMFPQDYVLVDECQDLNRAQQAIIQKILKRDRITGKQIGRLIAVGDPHQCQPTGTKVLMYDGTEKRIEDIVVGDRVVSYDKKHKGAFLGFYKNHRWGPKSMKNHAPIVEEVSNYLHTDSLFVVESNGRKTKYTANHRCFVRFRPNKTKGHAVYLMEKDGYFRIGITPLWSKNWENSVTARAKAERADKFWVLNIYDNKHDAYIEEQYNSLMFGIPQLRFVDNKTGLFNQEKIDDFYSRFNKNIMMSSALDLLNKFDRFYNYPFWEKGQKNYFSKTHLFEIKACNIIGEYMQMIHFDENNVHIRTHGNGRSDKQLKVQYYDIDNFYIEKYHNYVYSLKIGKYENYVADGMLTHNSIYSFAGSDIKSFEWFQKQENTKVLGLTHSFRCGEEIIKHAQKIVPDIKAKENAHEGKVREGSILEEATDGDFVLCRTTMPLVKLFFTFLMEKKKAIIKGSDIGISLVEMTKKHKSVAETLKFWDEELKEFEKTLHNRGILNFEDHSGYIALKDKVGVLHFFGKLSKTLPDMQKLIRQVFRDDIEGIVLSTVHKAKGLEADRVFIARPDILPMNASTRWQADQEKNLEYVAITRAKNELIYDRKWTDLSPEDLENLKNENKKIKTRRKRKN